MGRRSARRILFRVMLGAATLVTDAFSTMAVAQPAGDSARLEAMWNSNHIIPPGTYHLDRPISLNIAGIRILHLNGVIFDGTSLPASAEWLTQLCSAWRLQKIEGGTWLKGNRRLAIQINQNSCNSSALRGNRPTMPAPSPTTPP